MKREPAGPITLGNMRSQGPRSLDATYTACRHREIVNVNSFLELPTLPLAIAHLSSIVGPVGLSQMLKMEV